MSQLQQYLAGIPQAAPNPPLADDPTTLALNRLQGVGTRVPHIYRPMTQRSGGVGGHGRGGALGEVLGKAARKSPEGRQQAAQMADQAGGEDSNLATANDEQLAALQQPQNLSAMLTQQQPPQPQGWQHPATGQVHPEGSILHSPSTGQTFQVQNGQPQRYGPPQETSVTPESKLDNYENALAQTDPAKAADLAIKRQELAMKQRQANIEAFPINGPGSANYDAQQRQDVEEKAAAKGKGKVKPTMQGYQASGQYDKDVAAGIDPDIGFATWTASQQ